MEPWKADHVELTTELTMLPHPHPCTTEVKAERKEQKVQLVLSSPEELSPSSLGCSSESARFNEIRKAGLCWLATGSENGKL